ncbi:MAG: RloB domain-containing protein [Clostridia bacterium]|nr:RloB domain-containing protein [Clostridia bacterium]
MSKRLPIRPKRKFEHQIYAFYEGDQEYEYFNHLKNLINNHPQNKLKIKIVPKNCSGGDPRVPVYSAIKNCSLNKTPLVIFDYDNKKIEFEEAIDLAMKNKFNVGYSNINFDYWLTLHKLDKSKIVYGEKSNNDAYVKLLKDTYKLSLREDIKNVETIKKIISKITFEDVLHAINCCKLIEKNNHQNSDRKINTPNGNSYYKNPDIKVYTIVEELIRKCIKKED